MAVWENWNVQDQAGRLVFRCMLLFLIHFLSGGGLSFLLSAGVVLLVGGSTHDEEVIMMMKVPLFVVNRRRGDIHSLRLSNAEVVGRTTLYGCPLWVMIIYL